MREQGARQLLVVAEVDGQPRAVGSVSEHDIVTRVLALGLDPDVVTAGDIASFN